MRALSLSEQCDFDFRLNDLPLPMPLLDIATVQPSFGNHVFTLRVRALFHNKFVFGKKNSLASGWKSFQVPKREKRFDVGCMEMQKGVFMIRAIATLEPTCLVQNNGGNDRLQLGVDSRTTSVIQLQSSSEDSEELEKREKLRRMKISKANKGNMPWNKGRKHSAETLQRISERTRLAMQDPKVKMKLVNLGHAQSKETRMKIGVGVQMGWERRREKLMLQETCYFEWQNLIVEASRKGFVGEEELLWDSYKILDSQLEQEWLESVEQRKNMLRIKGNKKAPKPPEQRRKISEAISAKWADPVYRERVCHALANYHGTPVGAEKKLRRRPSGKSQPRTLSPKNHKAKDADNSFGYVSESQKYHMRLSRRNKPLYKDPLASSKLEMIKNIRAQRASAETKKTEAIEQAKLLIAEAEKAAKALEAAAMRSPLAQASLIETRKLIAEAIQSIQSIEIGQIDSHEIGRSPLIASMELANHVEENNSSILGLTQTGQREINVVQAMESSKSVDLGFGMFNFQDSLNCKDEVLPITSGGYGLVNGKEELCQTGPGDYGLAPSEVQKGNNSHEKRLIRSRAELLSRKEETQPNSITITKKWVRGRLVEIVERD